MKNDTTKIATLMTNLVNAGMPIEAALERGYDFACKELNGHYSPDVVMLIASEALKRSTSLMEFWPNTPCYAVKKESVAPSAKDETDCIADKVILKLESRIRQIFSEG